MVKINHYEKWEKTSQFAEIREAFGKRYLHSGEDYITELGKKQEIKCIFDGLFYTGTDRNYGNYVIGRHNPKFINGIDEDIISQYCHMSFFKPLEKNKFLRAGSIVGNMGNSGNCFTYENGEYRPITEKERIDINCKKGVHLHFGIYQNASRGEKTKILNEILKIGYVKERQEKHDIKYFWQWGKLFFKPEIIFQYFLTLT